MMNPTIINGNVYRDENFQGAAYAGPTGLPALLPDMVAHIAGAFKASSADSLLVQPGLVNLTVTPNRPYLNGSTARIQRVSDPTCFLQGVIVDYVAATGALVMDIGQIGAGGRGPGPFSDWQMLAFGLAGVAGDPGPTFNGGIITNTLIAQGAALNETSVSLSSAPTVNIGAAAANYITITGSIAISSFDIVQAGVRRTLVFNAPLDLIHGASNIILPNNVNVRATPGDSYTFQSEGGGCWRCVGCSVAMPVFRQTSNIRSGPSISAGVLNLDLATASVFDIALVANITSLNFLNPPSVNESSFSLVFTADGTARSVAWPANVKWGIAGAPAISASVGKQDVFAFSTRDGGATYLGFGGGQGF